VIQAAQDEYCDSSKMEEFAVLLCHSCRRLTFEQEESFIYDGRNSEARKLAEWWDAHQEHDRKREAEEAKAAEQLEKRNEVLAKLTPAERSALGF
jgi:hypothetical protein